MKRFFNALFSKLSNPKNRISEDEGLKSVKERQAALSHLLEITKALPPDKRGWIHLRLRKDFSPWDDASQNDIAPPLSRSQFMVNGREDLSRPELSPSKDASSYKTTSQRPPKKPPQKKKPQWRIDQFDVSPCDGETRFHDFNLPVSVMHAVCDLGFKYCTPVQAQVLPHALAGKDATARAQTGTGKSAAFLIAIITKLMQHPPKGKSKSPKGAPRALILAPTRELVIQIEKDAKALNKYNRLRTLAVFGGTGYKQQHDTLENRYVDIVAATPGRLIDFMGQKVLNLKSVEILVLDEADRMLDMGFLPDIRRIVYATPHKDRRQTMFFSATFTDDILRLASQWTNDAVQIEVDPEHAASENISQKVFIVTENEKMPLLYNLIVGSHLDRVILFVNRRDTTRRVSKKLTQYGIENGVLSGEVSQNQRMRTLDEFKQGKLTVLVATDVAARGLHIEGVSHVINYDLPQEAEHYVHRIGRTGRAGAQGISVSFADEMSSFHIPDIEAVLGEKLACEYPDDALLKALPKPKPLPKDTLLDEKKRGDRRPRDGRNRRSNDGKQKRQGSTRDARSPNRRPPSRRRPPRRKKPPEKSQPSQADKSASAEKKNSES